MVFGKRLEVAIHKFLCDNPHCTEVASDAELVANRTTNHVMAHLSMLRDLKEESRPGALWSSRKFPKTGRFRKALGQTHWAWLSPLLARMSLDGEGGGEEEELEKEKQKEPINTDLVDIDDAGYPTIFRRILGKTARGQKYFGFSQASDCEAASTVCYDEEGFPAFTDDEGTLDEATQKHREKENGMEKEEEKDTHTEKEKDSKNTPRHMHSDTEPPLAPRTRKRKLAALAKRKGKSTQRNIDTAISTHRDDVIEKIVVSGLYKESSQRIEITAVTRAKTRIHVMSASIAAWPNARKQLPGFLARAAAEEYTRASLLDALRKIRGM